MIPEVWFFGGICRETKKWFGEIVEDRSRESLLPLIKKYIAEGTRIISDQWSAYYNQSFDLTTLDGYFFSHELKLLELKEKLIK